MQWERPPHIFTRTALTADGWQRDVLLEVDATGHISRVMAGVAAPKGAFHCDLLLPGMSNVHSHAFQRAMAGLTEHASGAGQDNFWSWREVMYHFNHTLTPEQVEVTARDLYIALLKQGYTAVGEFHYLHHDNMGKPYANPAELSDRIIAAAQVAGIHLTHLPVLYETANFGSIPAHEGQRRFVHSLDKYIALLEILKKRTAAADNVLLGVAPHSLRAVKTESLKELLVALPALGLGNCPIHMHVAEQEKEVNDCIAWSGQRPIEWLFRNHSPDIKWCLIHATHANAEEIRLMAASSAVVGLCPTTEANLGDGIFGTEAYLHTGGRFGIGTDSNVSTSPWEELRLMEYVQRLVHRKRNVLHGTTPSVGRTLFKNATAGGAQALGIKAGQIAAGYRADVIAIDAHNPILAGKEGDALLDSIIFSTPTPAISDVFVMGKHVIANGHHAQEREHHVS